MIEQVTPIELKEALAADEKLVLLDVREPWEFDICRIQGSKLIPLGELHDQAEDLDREATYVLICHHGVRSMHALHMLRHLGFEKLKNLRGGVEAWSAVEPGFPRY